MHVGRIIWTCMVRVANALQLLHSQSMTDMHTYIRHIMSLCCRTCRCLALRRSPMSHWQEFNTVPMFRDTWHADTVCVLTSFTLNHNNYVSGMRQVQYSSISLYQYMGSDEICFLVFALLGKLKTSSPSGLKQIRRCWLWSNSTSFLLATGAQQTLLQILHSESSFLICCWTGRIYTWRWGSTSPFISSSQGG